MKSKTKLQHTGPTEAPSDFITGDLMGEGLLVVVDRRTHELQVRDGAEEQTVTVIVNPKGEGAAAPPPDSGRVTPPGTWARFFPRVSSDPLRQAGESLKRFVRPRGGEALYALTLHPDSSAILTVCDGEEAASVELSDAMVEQLIERLRSRDLVLPDDESI